MERIHASMGALEWALLGVLSVLWGGSFFFNHVAVAEVPPLTLVLLRVSLAAPILLCAAKLLRLPLPAGRRTWTGFLAMGLLNNALPFALIVWGQTRIASGLAAILNATTPLATVVVAHLFTADEKMRANRLAGVLAGFAGVAVLIGPGLLRGVGGDVAAELACLAAAFSYACAGVFGRRFRHLPPISAASGQVTASAVLLLPPALAVDRPWLLHLPGAAAMGAVAGLAVLCTALAYAIYFRILATAGATNLLLVTFLIPVSAIALGWLVLGEHLAAHQFLGLALVGAGLACIDGRVFRLRLPRPRLGG